MAILWPFVCMSGKVRENWVYEVLFRVVPLLGVEAVDVSMTMPSNSSFLTSSSSFLECLFI